MVPDVQQRERPSAKDEECSVAEFSNLRDEKEPHPQA